jgi:hypothetical protein
LKKLSHYNKHFWLIHLNPNLQILLFFFSKATTLFFIYFNFFEIDPFLNYFNSNLKCFNYNYYLKVLVSHFERNLLFKKLIIIFFSFLRRLDFNKKNCLLLPLRNRHFHIHFPYLLNWNYFLKIIFSYYYFLHFLISQLFSSLKK